MKKVAIVACNNGLGHTRRILSILESFYKNYGPTISADVFVDLEKIKYFPRVTGFLKKNKFKVSFFNVGGQGPDYEKEFLSKYKDNLKKADWFWSDNLIFPLKHRKDFFLTGSFVWPDAVNNAYTRREEDILRKNHPIMIGNKYFVMPKARSLTEFTGVGMYEYFSFSVPKRLIPGILLGCGKTSPAEEHFRKYVPDLLKEVKRIPRIIAVYIEPDFYRHFAFAKNVKMAEYSEFMFSRICASCIRPGFGSLSDSLLKGSRIFSFFENDNAELAHNADRLEKLNLGKTCQDPVESLSQAVEYILNQKAKEKHYSALKKLDFGGLSQTVSKIREILN